MSLSETDLLIENLMTPNGWGVGLAEICAEKAMRLDAGHYDPEIRHNIQVLKRSPCQLKPLSQLAQVTLPGKFARVWARDAEHGLPYLNATDLLSFAALGEPAQVRFLSKASNVDMQKLIVREGMILISCSGTIGRVFEVPRALDGWAATHDIIRVVPHDMRLKGYMHAYLRSPFAQRQIAGHTHGGQIDHVTDKQVGSCLVPWLSDGQMRSIAAQMDEAVRVRQRASDMIAGSMARIAEVLHGA